MKPFSSANFTRLFFAALAVIAICTAYFLGQSAGGNGPLAALSCDGEYDKGYQTAHQKLIASGLLTQINAVRTSIAGRVAKIDGGRIELSTEQLSTDPLGEPAPTERIVLTSSSTAFSERANRSPEEMNAAIAAFTKAKNPQAAPPAPFTEKNITLADLKVGDNINVQTDADLTNLQTIKNPIRITRLSQ